MKPHALQNYQKLIRSYYAGSAQGGALSARRVMAKSFDDGAPIVATPSEPPTNGSLAEYDVAIANPEFREADYAQSASMRSAASYRPMGARPMSSAPARTQSAGMKASSPECACEGPRTTCEPARVRQPETPGVSSSARAFTRNQIGRIVKDQDLLSDIQSILTGKPASSPSSSAPSARGDDGGSRQMGASGGANAAPAVSASPSAGSQTEYQNGHAIFDEIARRMSLATAYDLGSFDIEKRFDSFDRQNTAARSGAQSGTARVSIAADTTTAPEAPARIPPALLDETHRSDAAWPALPTSVRAYTAEERSDVFGDFEYEPAPDAGKDAIRILGGWEGQNIANVPIPQMFGLLIEGKPTKRKWIRFNKQGQDALQKVWAEWESAGLLNRIVTFDGAFVPRYVRDTEDRNPRPLSNHAWGTAFDINYKWNRLHKVPALVGDEGCVRELVAIANKHGFFWGGHFKGDRIDGMHFELGKIIP